MSLTKEVHRLMRSVRKMTDGQVTVESFDNENTSCQVLAIVIEPNDGLYKGGRFKFSIAIPDGYPHSDIPAVWCESRIYHPNIDTSETKYDDFTTNVCLNILENGTWNNSFGLQGIVLGLLFLMHNPNFEDPLSPYFEPGDNDIFITNVENFMKGNLEVEGETFELELVGENKDNPENKITNIPVVTEEVTQDGVTLESVEEEKKTLDIMDCKADMASFIAEEDDVSSDTIERDFGTCEYKVLSLDGEMVFICESENDTADETDKEVEEIRIDTHKIECTENDDANRTQNNATEMNNDDTCTNAENQKEKTAVNILGEKTNVAEMAAALFDRNHDRLPDQLCEMCELADCMSIKSETVKPLMTQNAGEGDHFVSEELNDMVSTKQKTERMNPLHSEAFTSLSQSPNCFLCSMTNLNAKMCQNEIGPFRRIAKKLFSNIQYIGCKFLSFLER